MTAPFDHSWRSQALAGDRAAITLLARQMVEPLFAFCFYRVGKRRDLCEEVVQETMVSAIRSLATYDPARSAGNVFPWLTGLARNQIQRVLAREKHGVSLEQLWERVDRQLLEIYARLEDDPFGPEVLQREETVEIVTTTMSQLPPHYRKCLQDKYLDGKSVRDMAGQMGVSEKAVESLLTRAREAFRATFLALAQSLGADHSIPRTQGT